MSDVELNSPSSPKPGDRWTARWWIRRVQLTSPGFVTYITEEQESAKSRRVTVFAWYDWINRNKATALDRVRSLEEVMTEIREDPYKQLVSAKRVNLGDEK
jgi:hypothetical protein